MDLKPGQLLGSYRIEERLVSGGMAKVYRALQPSTGREVAIKVLPARNADAATLSRFEREIRLVAGLQHPHVLGLIDAGHQGPWHYVVLPLVRNGDLADRIARQDGPLPLPVARRIALQLCDALEYAHTQGIVHRDVKPANVLLDERGNCLLTDFGIALTDGAERLTLVGQAVGTPEYLAPEQAAGFADARSDVYALGVIMFQMVTGRMPFVAHTAGEWLAAHRQTPVPSAHALNPDSPLALDSVLFKALAKQPGDRFRSAAELADALRAALPDAGADVTAAPTLALKSPAHRPGITRRQVLRVIAALAALAVLIGAFRIAQRSSADVAKPPGVAQPVNSAAQLPATAVSPPVAKSAVAPAPTAIARTDLASFDAFDDARFDGRFDPTRWQLTHANARVLFEQRDGHMHLQSQEREEGIYAELVGTQIAAVHARVRMSTPVLASQSGIGITISRADQPGRWASCYLYAEHGAALALPACTDQHRAQFRQGASALLGGWHDLELRVDGAGQRVIVSADGQPLGELPFAGASAAATWYVLLSGWSADGALVQGDIDAVNIDSVNIDATR